MPSKPPGTASRSDIYLHVQTKRAGKIKGEAVTDDHVDDIEVRSWTWGVAASTALGSGKATARRQYKHLVICKGIDLASTPLLSALTTNDEVKEAKLMLRKAGGDALDYYVMTLRNARVVGVDVNVDEEGVPLESVAFSFIMIDIEYRGQQSAGAGGGSTSFSDELLPSE